MSFVDQEIAHIAHAMALSLQASAETGRPVFPATYWRDRLRELMDRHHLQHGQLCKVDTLLRRLDHIDATHRSTIYANSAA